MLFWSQSLETNNAPRSHGIKGLTALELTGTDRQGLLSEVFAVLSDLQCNVVEAKVWTHKGRIASLIFVKDEDSGSAIEDAQKINLIERRLRNLLKGDNDIRSAKTAVSMAVTHTERRLHQMMFADRDYERAPAAGDSPPPSVSVQNWSERGYSVVYIQSRDRPKLLFDIVCTLTDMEYVVFHATIDTDSTQAYQVLKNTVFDEENSDSFAIGCSALWLGISVEWMQEFYIRHTDGSPISSEAERQRVIQCLQAAIQRRESEVCFIK